MSPRGREREVFTQIAAKFEELAELFSEVATIERGQEQTWTSVRLPPGRSRRWFAEFCLAQYRKGDPRVRKGGKLWECERSLLDQELHPPRRGAAVANDTEETWSPGHALERAGLRPRNRAP